MKIKPLSSPFGSPFGSPLRSPVRSPLKSPFIIPFFACWFMLCLVVPTASAQLKVHPVFQDHMILQRDKPVKVWGWGDPGKEVVVTFQNQMKSATVADDRTWETTLDPMPVNIQPQLFKVTCEGDALVCQDVLVGDLWVLTGQSNMELDLKRIWHGDTEVVSANHPQMRLLTIPAKFTAEPQATFESLNEWDGWHGRYDLKGHWLVCSPQTVPTFSGMGYIFGERLHLVTGVPIGLIDVSVGGTTVEGWVPREVLLENPANQGLINLWDARNKPEDRNNPGSSYYGMMHPLKGLSVKGIIFHQGFNNALGDSRPKLYTQNMKQMIHVFRNVFHENELPFGIIELSAGGEPQTLENFALRMVDAGTFIREAQLQVYKDLDHIGFVSAYDQQVNWYHPFLKKELSERMARWALTTQYGYELGWEPTLVVDHRIEGREMIIQFNKPVQTQDGRPMEGFALAGKDQHFYPAEARYLVTGQDERGRDQFDQSQVIVSCNKVKKPVAVRYAWARNPLGNLVNGAHHERIIPVPPFRTDNWDWPEAPFAENKDPEMQAHRSLIQKMKKEAQH